MEDARTRIVCTIGPASSSPTVLSRMMKAGMDVARLNFSHGTHGEHAALFKSVRTAARKIDKPVAILQDLQGPKIRVGALPKQGVALREGQAVTLTTALVPYKANGPIPVSYHRLHKDVAHGHRILLDDGALELTVLRVRDRAIHCSVDVGGVLTSHKGVNVPDSKVSASALTPKDIDDLEFGVKLGVDWVCVSFVTTPSPVEKAREIAREAARKNRVRPPMIMAKIERREALERFDDILEVCDGIMLGRGDLGVEIPPEEVPIVQKDITERCRLAGKPCIVATHMLESMKASPRATRAEISDIANAVFDHADAVMLSAESATGRYPAAAVQAMAAAIGAAEQSRFDEIPIIPAVNADMPHIFAQTVAQLAASHSISAVIAPASFPEYAMKLGLYRPALPIGIIVPDQAAGRQISLRFGVHPIVADDRPATFLSRTPSLAKSAFSLKKGAKGAVIAGTGPSGVQLTILEV